MLQNLSQLTTVLTNRPDLAVGLVASGVFGWDTMLSERPDRWSSTLFHTVARSAALTDDLVVCARDWFLQQSEGARRWAQLLWGTANHNVPVLDAVERQHWASATVLSRATHEARPALDDVPSVTRPRAWMARWHRQYAQDPEGWRVAASWLTTNEWVTAEDWSTPFNPGDSYPGDPLGDRYPLQVAMETHGVPEVEHLLGLGARPRGEMPAPEYLHQPARPLLFHLLNAWFLGPSLVSKQREPELRQAFFRLVQADVAAIEHQTVRFGAPTLWPPGLLDAPSLTDAERADLAHRATAVPTPGSADLPLSLVLRAVGPAPVRSFLEGRLLRENPAVPDVVPWAVARHRL